MGKPSISNTIESEAYASLTSVRTNKIVSNMIQISLMKYPFFSWEEGTIKQVQI
jgi:hypothetical protein